MKSLKIIIAVVSIAVLTVLTTSTTGEEKKDTREEVNKVQLDLISMTDKKSVKIPTQG